MIDPEFKQKWIAALLSGDYEQTTGCLRNENGFCCLGVACDVEDSSGWNLMKDREVYYYDGCFSTPPYVVSDKIGIEYSEINQLVDMNESGYSFVEISEWIQTNL